MKKYLVNTMLVLPIGYKEIDVEGAYADNSLTKDAIFARERAAIAVYPEIEIPDEAICISIETEGLKYKSVCIRVCRVLYLTPVDTKEAQP
jgi:hypothetical protein